MSQFYSEPYNYYRPVTSATLPVPNLLNNNRLTSYDVDANSVIINFSIYGATTSTARSVNTIYLITENVDMYNLRVGTTSVITNRAPSQTEAGLQYDRHSFTATSAVTATLTLTRDSASAPMKIYECYLMEGLLDIPLYWTYSQFTEDVQPRGVVIHQSMDGDRVADRGMSKGDKYIIRLQAEKFSNATRADLKAFRNKYLNFTFEASLVDFPDVIFQAHFTNDAITARPYGVTYMDGFTTGYIIEQR